MTDSSIRLGEFVYEPRSLELRGKGLRVYLRPQPARLLDLLIEHSGEVVSREDIRQALWPAGAVLEFETAISACVKQLRQSLRDDASQPSYVETIPRRGYRLIADVSNDVQQTSRTHRWLHILAPVALLSVLAIGIGFKWPASDERKMLMVLPFDIGPDANTRQRSIEYSDRLINRIGNAAPQSLAVMSRTSAEAFAKEALTARQIGRDAQVDFLVEGSLRQAGDRIYVSISLINARDGTFLWGELVESSSLPNDMDRSVQHVVHALMGTIAPGEADLDTAPQLLRLESDDADQRKIMND